MKKPFLTLILSLVIVLFVGLGSTFLLFAYRRAYTDFQFSPGKRVLVIGNSLGEAAFNDTILPAWQNACSSSMFYQLLAPALERQLAANPQIDTVCIVGGVTSFVVFNDTRHATEGLQNTLSNAAYLAFADATTVRDDLLGRGEYIPSLLLGASKVKYLLSRQNLGGINIYTARYFKRGHPQD